MTNLKKKILNNVFVAVAGLFLLVSTPVAAAQVRDNDGNAIIYGGAYSISELKSKLNNGTGKANQSGAELTKLFAYYGINEKDFGQLKDGYVTKDNQVIVGGHVVKTSATTMGRHDIKGSTRNYDFSYPLYLRHPSVSFLSQKLPAFVSMNYDGTYAYAILKPCGNIVTGPGVKYKPTPKPVVAKPVVKPIIKTVVKEVPVTKIVVREVPVVKEVSVERVATRSLPTSGPLEAAAGAVGLTASGGAAWGWLRSKRAMLTAISKVK